MKVQIFTTEIVKDRFDNHEKVVGLLSDRNIFNEKFESGLERFSLTKEQVLEVYGSFIEENICSLDDVESIEGPWLTVYEEGDQMESHNHSQFEYTMMHYIQLHEDHNQTLLEDPHGKVYTPDCVEGDIICIPGYVNHKVETHTSKTQRVVGVININTKNFKKPKEATPAWAQTSQNTPTYTDENGDPKNILEGYEFPGVENLTMVPVPDGMCKFRVLDDGSYEYYDCEEEAV